jgi:hypothetical protein
VGWASGGASRGDGMRRPRAAPSRADLATTAGGSKSARWAVAAQGWQRRFRAGYTVGHGALWGARV